MTDYKPGDRVRVSFEGIVDGSYDGDLTVVGPDNREARIDTGVPGYVVEKITPDYKAQIDALEPGTAFVLTHAGKEFTYFRTDGDRIINRLQDSLYIEDAVWLNSVTDIRILK